MRGKAVTITLSGSPTRITPAHAGKREQDRARKDVRKDHPRPCGEKGSSQHSSHFGAGSPPPMRGKVEFIRQTYAREGITPAHAGKRSHLGIYCRVAQDHPRPCGEKASRRFAL